jgi:hypothetical protein
MWLVHALATVRFVMLRPSTCCALLVTCVALACATADAPPPTDVSPAPPAPSTSPPLTDPPLQRANLHLSLSGEGIGKVLDALVPKQGEGAYALLGARQYRWSREPFVVRFDDAGKAIVLNVAVSADVDIPGTTLEALPLQLSVRAQPVISAQHQLQLQAVKVTATTTDGRVKVASWAGLIDHVEEMLAKQLEATAIDLSGPLKKMHAALQAPMYLPLDQASACFQLDVRGLEAGPMVMAGGLERDVALIIAPGITMPCTSARPDASVAQVQQANQTPSSLPPLFNVASMPSGPFALSVPIAAGYPEMRRALQAAFPQGRLYFSTEHPRVYLTDPDVFARGGAVVVKVKLAGFVEQGVSIPLQGELFLSGTPQLRDNFLEIPDLAPTVETSQALLGLAFALQQDKLTSAVRSALKLDIGERLSATKQKLIDALAGTHELAAGAPPLCIHAELGRMSLRDLQAHDAYLRFYADTTAYLSAELPCRPAP